MNVRCCGIGLALVEQSTKRCFSSQRMKMLVGVGKVLGNDRVDGF